MATSPYSQSAVVRAEEFGHGYGAANDHETTRRSLGAQVFIWLAWAAAAFFWGMSLTTGLGIVSSVAAHPGALQGGVDAGGLGFLLTDVLGGLVVLGLVIAFGAWRYHTRDRSKDALTERATANLYDSIADQGGEDLTTRSPEARSPLERDAARPSQSAFQSGSSSDLR